MTVWGLPEQTDSEAREAVIEQLTRALADHETLTEACLDMVFLQPGMEREADLHRWARHVVARALAAEAREHAGWSVAP